MFGFVVVFGHDSSPRTCPAGTCEPRVDAESPAKVTACHATRLRPHGGTWVMNVLINCMERTGVIVGPAQEAWSTACADPGHETCPDCSVANGELPERC